MNVIGSWVLSMDVVFFFVCGASSTVCSSGFVGRPSAGFTKKALLRNCA